ncbi:MAG: chromosome condensation protein CrcB [Planctomycetes bacterium GWF2_42_9]|nr:MAG: chromosome condensation protein CrcB [Planctomycetes bacterium GWF2_42_9]HAL44861.1 fluoride efflux transporter CrcB [Phycisphaerales bacterium]
MLQKFIYLALAGAAGTFARYWLGGLVQKHISIGFPYGTAVVNIVGCLFFGLLWAMMENRLAPGGQMRIIIFVGFFGAFTTFSTFMFETVQLLDESQWFWAAGNIVLQNAIGVSCMFAGLAIGKYI